VGNPSSAGQCELTIPTSIPKEPSPVPKAMGSQAAGPSPGTWRGPHAAVLQGLPGGRWGDAEPHIRVPHPAEGGRGERGGSGTWLCTVLFFRAPWHGREVSIALSSPRSEQWGDLPPALQAGARARQWGGKAPAGDATAGQEQTWQPAMAGRDGVLWGGSLASSCSGVVTLRSLAI